ncbi:ATP-dependent DNA helicase CHL1 [Golovinomyces cichoracearum]|uniref:ATP-dependent DNA helicase CHL1 n=1 Tax=Golovinomyces cichoracearum TaxID=62708 RepID=A0A420IJA7_9PEZI|nr:ATP-dependent DNA helicase CHL1 [Golovinomyces cichoracearum]
MTREFHHPYAAYDIQKTFMDVVYQVLENEGVGILESPTGTGKSLSLICGSLTWLRDHKEKALQKALDEHINDIEDEPDWVIEQARARKCRQLLELRDDMEARLEKIRLKEKKQHVRYLRGESTFKKRKTAAHLAKENSDPDYDEEQFVLDEYDSDHVESGSGNNSKGKTQYSQRSLGKSLYSAETLALLNELGMGPIDSKNDDEEKYSEIKDEVKIFYSSRTHSQLTQFINELRLPKFPSSSAMTEKQISNDQNNDNRPAKVENVKHVTLGSRKNLCIHPKISKLSSLTSINERCIDLQSSSIAKADKCIFLPNHESQPLVHSFRDHALAKIRDIEDMNSLGKEIGICPYYASRAAIKPAEIVTLPYPLLLQKSAREALGIDLKGQVVIIDEAHNLMDAISNINNVQISLTQLKRAREQLGIYLMKFRNRLKGKNRVYIAQFLRVIDSLSGYLATKFTEPKNDGTISEKDLLSGKGIDQINFFKLIHYLQENKIAQKVEGYAKHVEEDSRTSRVGESLASAPLVSKPEQSGSVIHQLTSLLFALTHPQKEGRLFYTKLPPNNIILRFLLLDPSHQFQEVISSARAVILAGGTMSPMSDYTLHLFPYLKNNRITTLSCGHVIPKSNQLAWTLSTGPSGREFEFTFGRRGDDNMIDDLGRAVLKICHTVPDGVVVFFPSYNYLKSILIRWSNSCRDNGKSILQQLEVKKRVFQERKDESVDKILQDYAQAIDSGKGGLLLSVVGGKMSEGINFSDALGRCVIIVGLPFPNINSAEWKAKIEFVEEAYIERLKTENISDENNPEERSVRQDQEIIFKKKAKDVSRDFYENTCMRAVNQSIGRAIRHKGDYAAIVMVDKRYKSERIKSKLPGWIKEGLVVDAGDKSFAALIESLTKFFLGKIAPSC